MKRRDFLRKTAGLGAAAALSKVLSNLPENTASAGQSEKGGNAPVLAKRAYGKTGVKLSIIGLGGYLVVGAEQKHANKVVAKAIEKGVNYFDVSPIYGDGDAEQKLGPALEPYRKNVFLACKTDQRERKGAQTELKTSLKRLRTDYLDLYQLHRLDDLKTHVDVVFAKGGAMEVFIEAKKTGRVRHLGFSAHSVEAAMAAMDRYDFDSVMFPINFACYYGGNFGRQVIKKAQQKKAAVLAIKTLVRRPWPAKWDRKEAELALRFTLSEPITAAIPDAEEKLFWLAVDIGMNFKPINIEEKKKIENWAMRTKPIFSYQKEDNKSFSHERG